MAEKSSPQAAEQTNIKETSVPEWEHIAANQDANGATRPRMSTKDSLLARLDTALPPHRKYIGLRRNVFLVALIAAILALLALIIGLAAGLSNRSKYVTAA